MNIGGIMLPVKSCSAYLNENMTTKQTLDGKLEQTKKPEQTNTSDSIDSINLGSLNSIASPLLFSRPDGTQGFVHDTYRDFFLARYFADIINSGSLTIHELYVNYWTLIDKTVPWYLSGSPKETLKYDNCRVLQPHSKLVIIFLAGMLSQKKLKELEETICHAHILVSRDFNYKDSPFEEDYNFALRLKGGNAHVN